MAKQVFPDRFKASRVKTKGRVDRGKQLNYTVFQNFDRTRSMAYAPLGKGNPNEKIITFKYNGKTFRVSYYSYHSGVRVLHKGAIETRSAAATNYYFDDKGKPRILRTSPTKVLTTEQAIQAKLAEKAPEDFWAGGNDTIRGYTLWSYRIVERSDVRETRIHFSRGRYVYVRVWECLKTIQVSSGMDKDTAERRLKSGDIFWLAPRKFKS